MVRLGYQVSRPTLDTTSRYDFILDDGVALYRVQVKTLRRRKNGNYELKLRATHRSSPDYVYTPSDVDYVCGIDVTNSTIVWVDSNDIKGQSSMTVGKWSE
jgi:hypothetical protein